MWRLGQVYVARYNSNVNTTGSAYAHVTAGGQQRAASLMPGITPPGTMQMRSINLLKNTERRKVYLFCNLPNTYLTTERFRRSSSMEGQAH